MRRSAVHEQVDDTPRPAGEVRLAGGEWVDVRGVRGGGETESPFGGQQTGQAEQTEITRRLAAGAAILAVPTAIAGIYGMNFDNMPELKWQYGYPLVLGVIVAICGWLYWRFRKNGWI